MKGQNASEAECPHCGGRMKMVACEDEKEAKTEEKPKEEPAKKGKSPGVSAVLSYKK